MKRPFEFMRRAVARISASPKLSMLTLLGSALLIAGLLTVIYRTRSNIQTHTDPFADRSAEIITTQQNSPEDAIARAVEQLATASSPDEKQAAYLNLGQSYQAKGDYNRSYDVLKKSIDEKHQSFGLFLAYANAAQAIRDHATTATYFEKAAKLAPKEEKQALQSQLKAAQQLAKAEQYRPAVAIAFGRATVATQLNQTAEAAGYFEKLIKVLQSAGNRTASEEALLEDARQRVKELKATAETGTQ